MSVTFDNDSRGSWYSFLDLFTSIQCVGFVTDKLSDHRLTVINVKMLLSAGLGNYELKL